MKPTKAYLLATVLAGCVLHHTTTFAADWPQYRGPSWDGKATEKVPAWPANGLSAVWKVATPGGFSSFAVVQGQAFTFVSREVEGAMREVLVALDAQSGRELWSATFAPATYGHGGGNAGTKENSGGDGPRSTPTVDGGRVYVLTSDLLLASFDAKTGREIWKRDIIKEHSGNNITWKNSASPVIEGDLIFVAGGGPGQALMGVNKLTGAVVWKGEDDKMTHATPTLATIHGRRQIVFFTQKGLVSVAPQDGKVLWRHPYRFNVSTAASPVVVDDIVFCSAGYGVGATAVQVHKSGDSYTVTELWRSTGDKLANHWSTPVYKDGHLYGMFQFKQYGDGPVKCVELKTGKEKWSEAGFGPGNLILAGDQLVILGDAGQLVLADATPSGYKERGRFQAVSGKCWSTPALAQGKLFVRSTREGAAFDLSSKLSQR